MVARAISKIVGYNIQNITRLIPCRYYHRMTGHWIFLIERAPAVGAPFVVNVFTTIGSYEKSAVTMFAISPATVPSSDASNVNVPPAADSSVL